MASQVAAPAVPTTLHVGSGKNFRPEWLNLDIEPRWRPDILFDISQPFPAEGTVKLPSRRFGHVTMAAESFDRILAQDVLEHIRDLTTAMTTMLHLLKTGGVLDIVVPYELSVGAWADPTHVRAFNEKSFDYYTTWSWYLGWTTHHFAITQWQLVATELGMQLQAAGKSQEEILRTPRAIEQIFVQLRKQPLSAEARESTAHYLHRQLAGTD
jgi:SAM-dependent methyltransferase